MAIDETCAGAVPEKRRGVRSEMLSVYDIPKLFYAQTKGSAAQILGRLGAIVWYADWHRNPGKKRISMNVDEMVKKWHVAVVGLAMAHDKDEADRYEASVEELLSPILSAPVKQIRELAKGLLESLKNDKSVPFLVWRSYEIWVKTVVETAPDEGVKELKTELAKEIVSMVEEDCKAQLQEAMIRALQWRSPEKLEEVKKVVAREKEAGRKTRMVGRESCLFLYAGGTDEEPEVCVQI